MKSFLNTQNIIISAGVFICLIGIFGAFSESFQLKLIPRDESGLFRLAKPAGLEGEVRRKLVNDVLWYPLKLNEDIYLGDSLQTDKDSSLRFEFLQLGKGILRINSDTLVRMKVNLKKPLIVLLQGDLEVSGDSNDDVFVTAGLKVKKIQIRKNALVRVKRTEDGDLEIKTDRTDITNEQGRTEIGQSKDIWVNSKADGDEVDEQVPRPVKYPYPDDQTAFLQMGSGKITLFPAESCENGCHLRVLRDGKESRALSFKQGQRVMTTVDYEKSTDSSFNWTFEGDGKSQTGVFYIKPYSGAEMKRQMQLKHPIEILSGI